MVLVNDAIYGYFDISDLAEKLLKTPYLNRLNYIRQIGGMHTYIPSASHTRLQHSLGVYHLCDVILQGIKRNSDKKTISSYLGHCELTKPFTELDDDLCEAVKIAGLCHDIGHGPLGHIYDVFTKERHEKRSVEMIDHIEWPKEFRKYLRLIKSLIDPEDKCASFLHSIVNNKVSGLDLDKFDYIVRDSKFIYDDFHEDVRDAIGTAYLCCGRICFDSSAAPCFNRMFRQRRRLFDEGYRCPKTMVVDEMGVDLMKALERAIDFGRDVRGVRNITPADMSEFATLTDASVLSYGLGMHDDDSNSALVEYRELLGRLKIADTYKIIGHVDFKKKVADVEVPHGVTLIWGHIGLTNKGLDLSDVCVSDNETGGLQGFGTRRSEYPDVERAVVTVKEEYVPIIQAAEVFLRKLKDMAKQQDKGTKQ